MPSFKLLVLAASLLWSSLNLSLFAASDNVAEGADNRLVFHGGVTGLFDNETIPVAAFEYRWGHAKAGFQPWAGAGWATDGAVFVGGGVFRTWRPMRRWEWVVGFGPGYYDRHEGKDLGGQIEFYSFGETSWEIAPGRRLLLRFAHISNASLSEINPGTELLTLGFSLRLR